MIKYFIKRCLSIIPVLIVVSILAFAFVHLLPGDPARMMAGEDADPETVEMLRTARSWGWIGLCRYNTSPIWEIWQPGIWG